MKKKREFSKSLLIQESVLVWITTIACLILSFLCVLTDYCGELTFFATTITAVWAAYGVSQACYYKKAEKENILKISSQQTAEEDYDEDEDLRGL